MDGYGFQFGSVEDIVEVVGVFFGGGLFGDFFGRGCSRCYCWGADIFC